MIDQIVSTAITITPFCLWLYRKGRQFSEVINTVPGLKASVDELCKQFKPNGGSSIPDRLARIELRQMMSDQMQHHTLGSIGLSVWQADAAGKCVYASHNLGKMMGCQVEQLLGFGWLSYIHADDRESIRQEWLAAVKDEREFYAVTRFLNGIPVRIEAHPLREEKTDKAAGYVALFSLIPESKV